MKKSIPAESPEAYVVALSGWHKDLVEKLRRSTLAAAGLREQIKWGHLVYFSNGPALLIRAEENRVLLGFWRGKRMLKLDTRLKASGKYELANMVLVEGDEITATQVTKLVMAAIDLNRKFGDPTAAGKSD